MGCLRETDCRAEVKTPVDIEIRACLGEPEIRCNGEPSTVISDCGNGCRLYVVQRLNVRVPLCYEAHVRELSSEITCAKDC